MKQLFKLLLIFIFLSLPLFANKGKDLAKQLRLNASIKATSQWDRVFQKERKMKKLGIDRLSDTDKHILLEYLKNHAADSDAPEAAGI
jgi:hypothetical protein